MRSAHKLTALLFSLLVIAACDSRPTGPLTPQAMTGFWSGRAVPPLGSSSGTTISGGTSQDSVRLALDEDAQGQVSGSATVTQNQLTRVYQVSGHNFFPQVVLTLDPGNVATGGELLQLRGEFVSDQSLQAQLFGNGFNGDRVLLERRQKAF